MAFSVPTFPLFCDVYTGPWVGKTLRVAALPCNLALGRRVQTWEFIDATFDYLRVCPHLLVPALSDVRDSSTSSPVGEYYDVIEVPAASGRWYRVNSVDDVAKGFPNEYRMVGIGKIFEWLDPVQFAGAKWPTPIP